MEEEDAEQKEDPSIPDKRNLFNALERAQISGYFNFFSCDGKYNALEYS